MLLHGVLLCWGLFRAETLEGCKVLALRQTRVQPQTTKNAFKITSHARRVQCFFAAGTKQCSIQDGSPAGCSRNHPRRCFRISGLRACLVFFAPGTIHLQPYKVTLVHNRPNNETPPPARPQIRTGRDGAQTGFKPGPYLQPLQTIAGNKYEGDQDEEHALSSGKALNGCCHKPFNLYCHPNIPRTLLCFLYRFLAIELLQVLGVDCSSFAKLRRLPAPHCKRLPSKRRGIHTARRVVILTPLFLT